MPQKSKYDHLYAGFCVERSLQLLVSQQTFDHLAAEKAVAEKLANAAVAMAASKHEIEANTIGHDYAAEKVGTEGRTNKKVTHVPPKILGLTMQLYDPDVVDRKLENDTGAFGDRDERRARRELLKKILDSGSRRQLARVQADTDSRLDGLQEDFPNFGDVIQYLRGVVAIALADDRTPQPQPLLLCGAPGIGKTLFSECIASIFGTQLHVAHLETMQTSADLVGTSCAYSNATTGQIFNALIEGEYANPLFLLDEIDKASGDDRRPTTMALFKLLERTSEHFHDESLPWLTIDASRILYIATANGVDLIDPALLSRFRVFDIEAPCREQSREIVHSVFSGIVRSRPRAFERMRMTSDAIEKLLDLTPRKMKAALTTAAGNALIDGRDRIETYDIEIETDRKRQSIGFVS